MKLHKLQQAFQPRQTQAQVAPQGPKFAQGPHIGQGIKGLGQTGTSNPFAAQNAGQNQFAGIGKSAFTQGQSHVVAGGFRAPIFGGASSAVGQNLQLNA